MDPIEQSAYNKIKEKSAFNLWAGIINFLSNETARDSLVCIGTVKANTTTYTFTPDNNTYLTFDTTKPIFDYTNYNYIMIYGPIVLKQCDYDSDGNVIANTGDWYFSKSNTVTFINEPETDELDLTFYIICLGKKNNTIYADE